MHFNACTKKVTNEQTDYLTIYLCLGNSFTSPHLVLIHNYSPSTCSHSFCRGYLIVLLNYKTTKQFLVSVSTILLCWLKPEAILLFRCFTMHFFNSLNNENQPLHFTLDRFPVVSLGIFSVVPPTEPCALRSTQPLKVSTRDFFWAKDGRCFWLTTYHPCSAETSR